MDASRTTTRRLARMTAMLAVVLLLVVIPSPAHAVSIGSFALNSVLDIILGFVTTINALLGQLLNAMKDGLKWALTLKVTSGVTVVEVAWRLVRDLCNFVFIIMLVVISFSSIFNVIPSLQRFNYRNALLPLLVAALVMNFSLAIGKAFIKTSNTVAGIFVRIMPNLGDDLTKALTPQQFIVDPKALVGTLPPGAPEIFNATKSLTQAEDKRLKECLNEEKEVVDTNAGFVKYTFQYYFGGEKVRKSLGDCNLEILAARRAAYKVAAGQELTAEEEAASEKIQTSAGGADSASQRIFLILSGVLSGAMLLLLISCLFSAFLFILIRIIMLWVLLFSSPVAWAGYAVPGSGVFRQWWNLFIGWNLFGPVYLFVLIPGMMILSSSGEMLTAISRVGGDIGTAAGMVQIFLFYAFAVLVFLGGLAVAMRSSFAGAVRGTAILGGLAGQVGALDAKGLGGARFAGRVAGAAGRATGVSATLKARQEQLAQKAGELRRRYAPELPFKSYDERLAQERQRLGVAGGEKAYTDLKAKQVTDAQDNLKKLTASMSKDDQRTYLERRINSANRAEALAAREELLKRGLLIPAQVQETRDMYAKVSPGALRAFNDRVKTAAGAAVREKKKEAEEKRENIIAQVESLKTLDQQTVKDMLDPYYNPPAGTTPDTGEQRAVEEALGRKAPSLLLDYLNTTRPGAASNRLRAFEPTLKDPKALLGLGDAYLTPGSAENTDLKDAINEFHPKGAGGATAKDREQMRRNLIKQRPSAKAEIDQLFT